MSDRAPLAKLPGGIPEEGYSEKNKSIPVHEPGMLSHVIAALRQSAYRTCGCRRLF